MRVRLWPIASIRCYATIRRLSGAHLANSNAEGTFFYGVSAFIVAGVKI